ncbi:peptidylprolyl isomerase [Methanoregula sp.]|jgi:peptidylprolyl isomerase|uniref:FKBP-type peptidyl-prolyl cis-trans isomerase n=1 Tax=Methanoregula sp. TaxID=2052170 RepID=UPI0025D066DE|nr:peptidylprolyl isomerase [Methanoregula sp.]
MKKSEKLKGKEKVAAHKRQYKLVGVVAVVIIIAICAVVYVTVFNPFVVAEVGDTVNVTYTGMFENKTVFDTNVNKSPLTFTIGSGKLIPGFDAAVRGMKKNEEKTVTIPYDQAYGAYNPALVQIIPQSKFPANQTIVPGEKFYFQSSVDGSVTQVTVVNVTSLGVTVDANSPLAGQNLTFDIKIDSIQKGSSGSTATGTS